MIESDTIGVGDIYSKTLQLSGVPLIMEVVGFTDDSDIIFNATGFGKDTEVVVTDESFDSMIKRGDVKLISKG